MRVIFQGDPNEIEGMAKGLGLSRTSTVMFGVVFPMSAEVDVSHLSEVQQRKLANNSHFRVAGVDAEPVRTLILPAAVQQQAQSAESAPPANDDAAAMVAAEEAEPPVRKAAGAKSRKG